MLIVSPSMTRAVPDRCSNDRAAQPSKGKTEDRSTHGGRHLWASLPGSPVEVIGPKLIPAGKAQQFALRVWEPAIPGDLAKPTCELAIMRASRLAPSAIIHHRDSNATNLFSAHTVPVAISASRLT